MKSISLNGKWSLLYSQDKPEANAQIPDFATAYETEAVPGYWEDMYEGLKEAPFFNDLVINPEYKYLEYPIILPLTKSIPDMSLETVVGTFWYKRDVEIPSDAENKSVLFKCAGVQNRALLWVNGEFAGEHKGYSAPFELDVTSLVKAGETNTFVFAVSNHQAYNENGDPISGCTSRAANRFTGGIMGDVTLEILDRYHINSVYVTDYNFENNTFDVITDVTAPEGYQLKWQIFHGEGYCYCSCGSSKAPEFTLTIPDNRLKFWSPKEPNIFRIEVTLVAEGRVCHTHVTRFGLRRLEARGTKLYLNNEPVYLRGICEHGYYPVTVHPTGDIEYYRNVIRKLKELDFNFIRFHTWIPTEEYMTAADELGMLLHVECPNNTTEEEFKNIVRFVRRHPSVVICCMGNEMYVGDEEIEKFRRCADYLHANARGINFSPMSAMRGVEYFYQRDDHTGVVDTPIEHHPERFEKLREFCDLFSSFSLSHYSYQSHKGNPEEVDSWAHLYKKPRVTHETCILGTYPDLELEKRYEGTRIGKTELFAGPRKMLENLGIIDKANIYYKNSCMWQGILRKQAFENVRLTKTVAGYDFLGDIDHHWHTSGYRVGLMNEFYELKPGVTVENVRQYNGESVILSSLNNNRIYLENTEVEIDLSVSQFSGADLENEKLTVKIESSDSKFHKCFDYMISAKNGEVEKVASVKLQLPKVSRPTKLTIYATLPEFNNEWDIWVFPECDEATGDFIITCELTPEILKKLDNGADVLMIGTNGLYHQEMEFRIAYPGRIAGNLATVIEKHPLTDAIDNDGYCSWQFYDLMEGGSTLYYPPETTVPFEPVIDVASSYKWVRRGSALSEFKVGKGRLLISTFNSGNDTVSGKWWRYNLAKYMTSKCFEPRVEITLDDLKTLMSNDNIEVAANTNVAQNSNDITMKKN